MGDGGADDDDDYASSDFNDYTATEIDDKLGFVATPRGAATTSKFTVDASFNAHIQGSQLRWSASPRASDPDEPHEARAQFGPSPTQISPFKNAVRRAGLSPSLAVDVQSDKNIIQAQSPQRYPLAQQRSDLFGPDAEGGISMNMNRPQSGLHDILDESLSEGSLSDEDHPGVFNVSGSASASRPRIQDDFDNLQRELAEERGPSREASGGSQSASERSSSVRPSSERAGSERAGSGQSEPERAGSGQSESERAGSEQAGSEQSESEQSEPEQSESEQSESEQSESEQPASEQSLSKRRKTSQSSGHGSPRTPIHAAARAPSTSPGEEYTFNDEIPDYLGEERYGIERRGLRTYSESSSSSAPEAVDPELVRGGQSLGQLSFVEQDTQMEDPDETYEPEPEETTTMGDATGNVTRLAELSAEDSVVRSARERGVSSASDAGRGKRHRRPPLRYWIGEHERERLTSENQIEVDVASPRTSSELAKVQSFFRKRRESANRAALGNPGGRRRGPGRPRKNRGPESPTQGHLDVFSQRSDGASQRSDVASQRSDIASQPALSPVPEYGENAGFEDFGFGSPQSAFDADTSQLEQQVFHDPDFGIDDQTDLRGLVRNANREDMFMPVVRPNRTIDYKDMAPGIAVAQVFETDSATSTRSIIMQPGAVKPPAQTKDNTLFFRCERGSVRVVVHKTEFLVGPKSFWMVPPRNSYMIENRSNFETELVMFQNRQLTLVELLQHQGFASGPINSIVQMLREHASDADMLYVK